MLLCVKTNAMNEITITSKKIINKTRILFLLSFIFVFSSAFSQKITVSGKVVDKESKKALERVIIYIKQTDNNKIIAFSQTKPDGTFEITKEFDRSACKLEASYLGYASQTRDIPEIGAPLLIEMLVQDVQLKEVAIKAPKIRQRGDTIIYQVSTFSNASDRTIGDVLKKMPGIEVGESGQIKYQGQDINKFYIEGSDLLGGRYGLATNNVSHKDVSSVEVMEKHQPVKALEDLAISNSPAINIKLKEDAKSRWAGTIKAGAGFSDLWLADVFAMRFKKKTQNINTYKGNNIGDVNPNADLLASLGVNSELPNYIHVNPSLASGVGNNRNRFEQKHGFTTNSLIKTGKKEYELLPELILSQKKQDSEYQTMTTYFLGDETLLVEERKENAESVRKELNGKLQLRGNKERFYLNNTLKFDANWNETDMNISGTYPNAQKAMIEYKKISNDFDLLKRIKNNTITIRSINQYAEKPQELFVRKNNESPLLQNVNLSSFDSRTSLQYGFVLNRLYINTSGNVSYSNKVMNNTLNETTNELRTEKTRVNINPSLDYKSTSFNAFLSLPVFYQYLSVHNQYDKLLGFNPNLWLDFIVSSKLSLLLSGSYNMGSPNEGLFYLGEILSNYRTINTGYIDFAAGKSFFTTTGIKYQDILNSFFADITASFSNSEQKNTLSQDFINDFIINSYVPAHITSKSLTINSSISKGFDWIDGIVGLYPLWNLSEGNLTRNSIDIPYTTNLYGIRGKINSNKIKWCGLSYNFSYNYNEVKTENQPVATYDRFSESLTVDFFILKSLQLKFICEHYRNQLTENEYRNFIFSDIMMSYLPGKKWELSLSVKNIFNEKNYSYIIENQLISSSYNYKIRPRDILLSASYRF